MRRFMHVVIALGLLSLVAVAKEQTVTEFVIKDVNGKSYKAISTANGIVVEEAKGKVLFIEFFGYKCPPCLQTIPHFKRLQEKYKDKLEILAFEVQGLDKRRLKEFIKEKGINYKVFVGDENTEFINHIGMRAMWSGAIPFTIVLDSKHEVNYIQPGLIPEKLLEDLIGKLYVAPKKEAGGSSKSENVPLLYDNDENKSAASSAVK